MAGCYVDSRFSVFVAFASFSCLVNVYDVTAAWRDAIPCALYYLWLYTESLLFLASFFGKLQSSSLLFLAVFWGSGTMADNGLLVLKKNDLQSRVGRLPVLLLESFQNWGMTQNMTVISVKPKTVDEVVKVVNAIRKYNDENSPQVSLRCVGDGHSWSPLFPDNGNVLMFISQLIPTSEKRITLNEVGIGTENPLTVTIAPGVTTGELSKFFTENNVCFKTDVILDKVTYGGVIAPGCHGVGKDQLAVSDYVKGMNIVGADGVETEHTFPSDNQVRDNALKCNMGLFGVMTSITMEVQPMVIVKVENDFSKTVEDLFYNPTALEQLYKENWSLEIFWFPFNSLSWLQLITLFHCRCPKLVRWNPKKDKLWIRKINPAYVPNEPTPNEVEYGIKEVQDLVSTGFGRTVAPHLNKNQFLIPSFLKAGFEMVKMFNTRTRFEPINKAIHYQSFIEVMPVLDMEFAFNANPGTFSEQVKAMQAAVHITKDYYYDKKFPLSVVMEMRWMAYSDCLICPARAVHKESEGKVSDKQTLYLEVLGLAGQENWEDYTKEIADEWMGMKINGMAPLPHWAKQWSYLDGIDNYIKTGYGNNLTDFRNQVKDDEKLLFSNARLNTVIFQDPQKESEGSKIKQSKSSVKAPGNDALVEDSEAIIDDLKKHVETWKNFFMTLGEQVWNVPFKVPKLEIQKEWKNTEGILYEINKKYPHLSIEEDLYKNLFT